MAYQNLFEALQNVCGFTALESDMLEIINAYEKDKAEQLPQADVSGRSEQFYCVCKNPDEVQYPHSQTRFCYQCKMNIKQ